jgi:hypothetical protein
MLLPLLLAVGGPFAREGKGRLAPRPGSGKPAKVSPVEVQMADGSIVRATLLQESILVNTRYGRLTVPAEEVQRIELGLRYPPGAAARIEAAIRKLGSKSFEEREAAGKELLTRGELAYRALTRAAGGRDKEAAKRARDLLKALEAAHSEERLHRKEYDLVYTPTFTIAGRVDGAALKARTAYFGEVQLRLGDMIALRSLATGDWSRVVVDAAKYGVPARVWLETNIEVRRGSTLRVRATGQVDLYPLGAEVGTYISGPAGLLRVAAARGFVLGQQVPGALLGRIGKSGRMFVIGAKYEETVREDGKLYLSIAPSPWNNVPSGEYTARISPR